VFRSSTQDSLNDKRERETRDEIEIPLLEAKGRDRPNSQI
jgi:hypothetical protein